MYKNSATLNPIRCSGLKGGLFLLIALGTAIAGYAQQNNPTLKQVQVIKDVKDLKNNNFTVYTLENNNTIQKEAVSGKVINLRPDETYVFQSKNESIVQPDQTLYNKLNNELREKYAMKDIKLLPETFVQTGASGNKQLVYRIGFESKLPLEYLFPSGQFEGTMKFFLLPESYSDIGAGTLKMPVMIEVVSDDIRTIVPVSKEIDHLSIPLTEIKFEGIGLSDSAQVKIITKSNPGGYETYLKVKPAIALESKRSSFQGLGIQEIPVSIRMLGSSAKDSVKVSLNAGKGTVHPGSVYLHSDKPTIVNLRSEGLGYATLSVSSVLNSNVLKFEYIFPWVFILMAIIGGAVGGLINYFTKQEKTSLLNFIFKGILLGFMGAIVYYALGFSLIEFEVSDIFNEFAVLGFSALVAFFGIRIKTS